MSIFKNAVNNAGTTKKAKTTDKLVIDIPAIADDLERLATVQGQIADLKVEEGMLAGVVKEAATNAFINEYSRTGVYPGSFNVRAGSARMMFVPQDKYITIDADRAAELKKNIGDVVDEQIVYTMDTDLVEKYGDVISKLIENCKEIPDADKARLISASVKYSVKKGTISQANAIKGTSLEEVITEIKPIFQIKGATVATA